MLKPNGTATDMLNVRVTGTDNYNVLGNLQRAADYILPSGENKVIGTLEDKQGDRIIYFIYNSDAFHRIVLYNPATFASSTILEWDGLDFQENDHIESAIIDNILIFAIKGRGEIKQLDITKTADYDAAKAADPYFINLIKRMPVRPLVLTGRIISGSNSSHIGNIGVQATYQYVYEDNQVSKWAPLSEISPIPYSLPDRLLQGVRFDMHGDEIIPPFVKKIKFAARINNTGGLTVFKVIDAANFWHSIDFFNNTAGEVVPEETALALFDAVPLSINTLELARNRVQVGGYKEGYDTFDSLEISFAQDVVNQTGIFYGDRIMKSNSSHKIGIQPKDYAGRTLGVITKPEWSFNIGSFYQKDINGNWDGFVKSVAITVQGSVPDWVESLQIVVSNDLNHSYFIQGFGYFVFDLGEYNGRILSQMVLNGYAPQKTYINIRSLTDRQVGYIFEEGDFVNVYYNDGMDGFSDATWQDINGEYSKPEAILSLRVIGQQGELIEVETPSNIADYTQAYQTLFPDRKDGGDVGDGVIGFPEVSGAKFYVIRNGNFKYGLIFEIYRPAIDDAVFYEIGAPIIVGNPNVINETVALNGNTFLIENTQKNDLRYSSYQFYDSTDNWVAFGRWDGSTYYYYTPDFLPTFFPYVEAMSPWGKYYTIWGKDFGKPTAVIPEAKQVYKKSFIRFSNKYLSGTMLNGLNAFEALNEKDLPAENGAINKLIIASNSQAEGTVLLAIQQNETESIYLGEMQYRDTQGDTTVAISDAVLGSNNTLRGGFGTINPESVVADGSGNVYWWDAYKGTPVRYAANGNTALAETYGMQTFFRELSRKQLPLKEHIKVYGGYDPVNREYIMHFAQYGEPDGEVYFAPATIAFSEKLKGFTSRYDFQPEAFAKSNTLYFSFKDGAIWEHEANPVCNNFYGQQFKSSIQFISNQEPSQVKIWNAVAIEGQQVWVPKEMRNEAGQFSLMKPAWFANREGVFYGAIRRDTKGKTGDAAVINLNNGNVLRSAYLDILLENESTELTRLDAVNIIYTGSTGHQTIN